MIEKWRALLMRRSPRAMNRAGSLKPKAPLEDQIWDHCMGLEDPSGEKMSDHRPFIESIADCFRELVHARLPPPPPLPSVEASAIIARISASTFQVLAVHRSFLRQLTPLRMPDEAWLQGDVEALSLLNTKSVFYINRKTDDIFKETAALTYSLASREGFVNWQYAIFVALVVLDFHGMDTSKVNYDEIVKLIRYVRDVRPIRRLGARILPASGTGNYSDTERNPEYPFDVDQVVRDSKRYIGDNRSLAGRSPEQEWVAHSVAELLRTQIKPTGKAIAQALGVSRSTYYARGWSKMAKALVSRGEVPAEVVLNAEAFCDAGLEKKDGKPGVAMRIFRR